MRKQFIVNIILRFMIASGIIFSSLGLILGALTLNDKFPQLSAGKPTSVIVITLIVVGLLTCFGGLIWLILPLLNKLKFDAKDSIADYIILGITRVIVAVTIGLLGLMFAFGSTMGPEITPLLEGKLDIVLRISSMGVGFLTFIFMFIWLIWPVLNFGYRKIASGMK